MQATICRPSPMSPLEQLRSDCLLYVPCYRLDGNPFSSRDVFRRKFQGEARWMLPTGGSGVNWSNIPYAYDDDYHTLADWNCVGATAYNIRWQAHCNEDAWVYDDKGAGHFGSNWVHKIDVKIKGHTTMAGRAEIHLLSNDIDDSWDLKVNGKTFISLRVEWVRAVHVILLEETYLGVAYTAQWAGAQLGTWYYFTITKTGTGLSCTIYSDAARTNPIITLSLTLHADHSFQYIFAVDTFNYILLWAPYCDVYVANLDLGDGGGNEDFLTYTKADPLLPPLHKSHIKFYGGQSPPLTLTLDSPIVCTRLYAAASCNVQAGIACVNCELYYDGAWHAVCGFPATHDFGEAGGGMGVEGVFNIGSVATDRCRWTIGYPGVETTDAGVRETHFWKFGQQPYWTPRGRYYDGVNKWYLDCGDIADLPSDDGMTLIAIVNALASGDQSIFWKGDKTTTFTGGGLGTAPTSFIGHVMGPEGGSFDIDSPIILNKFVHLALTVDFHRRKVALWLNGDKVAETDYTDSGKWVNNNPLTIGYNPDMDMDFNGYVKAAWAYRRALTPVEMMAHCRSTRACLAY